MDKFNWCPRCKKKIKFKAKHCTECGSKGQYRQVAARTSDKSAQPSQTTQQAQLLELQRQMGSFVAPFAQAPQYPFNFPVQNQPFGNFFPGLTPGAGFHNWALPPQPMQSVPAQSEVKIVVEDDESAEEHGGSRTKKRQRVDTRPWPKASSSRGDVDPPRVHRPSINVEPRVNPFLPFLPSKKLDDSKKAKSNSTEDISELLPGIHGFSRPNPVHKDWCFKHHHIMPDSGCKRDDELVSPYSKYLAIALVGPITPLGKMEAPSTHLAAMQQLRIFGTEMQKYLLFVPKRDELQQNVIRALKDSHEVYDWASSIEQQLARCTVEINVAANEFFHVLQRLTKQCACKYSNVILQDLHKYKLGLDIKMVGMHGEHYNTVLGNYSTLQEVRSFQDPPLPVDLPITGKDRTIWAEFVGHIVNECQKYAATIQRNQTKLRDVRIQLSSTPLRPLTDCLTTGGFGPTSVEDRTTTLPTFHFADIESLTAQTKALYQAEVSGGQNTIAPGQALTTTSPTWAAVQDHEMEDVTIEDAGSSANNDNENGGNPGSLSHTEGEQ